MLLNKTVCNTEWDGYRCGLKLAKQTDVQFS